MRQRSKMAIQAQPYSAMAINNAQRIAAAFHTSLPEALSRWPDQTGSGRLSRRCSRKRESSGWQALPIGRKHSALPSLRIFGAWAGVGLALVDPGHKNTITDGKQGCPDKHPKNAAGRHAA